MDKIFTKKSRYALCGAILFAGVCLSTAYKQGSQTQNLPQQQPKQSATQAQKLPSQAVNWQALLSGGDHKEILAIKRTPAQTRVIKLSITNEQAYKGFWTRAFGLKPQKAPALPAVDFKKESLVAIRSSASRPYIHIESITTRNGRVNIVWSARKQPGPQTYNRFVILKVDAPRARVQFREIREEMPPKPR
jgi:hypothetical protein